MEVEITTEDVTENAKVQEDPKSSCKDVLLTVKTSKNGYGSMTASISEDSDATSISSYDGSQHIELSSDDDTAKKINVNSLYDIARSKNDRFVPGVGIKVTVNDVVRTPRSHPLNPNLYTVEITHGNFVWSIQRRHRHFLNLYTDLMIAKATSQLPTTKRDKIKCKIPSFPKRPEISVIGIKNLERRKRKLERFLQSVMNKSQLRNEQEVLDFFEISIVSFLEDLGGKNKETLVEKRAGGHRAAGCSGALRCSCCGAWNERWLALKDSCVLYLNPETLVVRDVLLMDSKFTVHSGKEHTGLKNGLVISNDSRDLSVKCKTRRDTREWITAIVKTMASTASDWVKEHHNGSFAPIRKDSQIQWFVDAADYMSSVADAIERAEEEIFITDWWLCPEIHLKRPVRELHKWRLDELLKRKARDGVRVYVIMYKEIELTLPINSYYSKQVLHSLHDSNIKVLRHPDHLPGSGTFLWAHHEKIVCIDQKIAFLGGVDLCYGRWDNKKHKLIDFGSARPIFFSKTESTIANISKMFFAMPPVSQVSSETNLSFDADETDSEEVAKYFLGKDYCNPYIKDVLEVEKPLEDSVDRNMYPRMPWHDIAAVVYGPAARDVGRHFIQRWNFTKKHKAKEYEWCPLLIPKTYNPMPDVIPLDASKVMNADCQILRSVGRWSAGVKKEDSIHKAYVSCIKNSKHFIYIENQFFITSLKSDYVHNNIGDALVERILEAILKDEKFMIIVVMPLLPSFPGEIGQPAGASKLAVEHWNFRSICRSSESILDLLRAKGVEDPSKYIRFYGLRNYADLQGKLVTEIVYVHSKMMIVDDRMVIIGSANINDRSMLGDRDSEIAVIVHDTEMIDSEMNGQAYKAGKFALSLRCQLYREHLGLFKKKIDFDVTDPLSEQMMDFWISTARKNTEVYNEVFACLPCDDVKSFAELEAFNSRPVLASSDPVTARKLLKEIQGFLVEKPLKFLENQDMRPGAGTAESLVPGSVFT